MSQPNGPLLRLAAAAVLLLAAASSAVAFEVPRPQGQPLRDRELRVEGLSFTTANVPLQDVLGELPNGAAWQEFLRRHAPDVDVHIDPRSGTPSAVMTPIPFLPGTGAGNAITHEHVASAIGRPLSALDAQAVADAWLRFVMMHRDVLAVDTAQIGRPRASRVNDYLWQLDLPQVVGGIPVRDARISGTVNHGNLVLFGTERWGNVGALATAPTLRADDAVGAVIGYTGGLASADRLMAPPHLEIIPMMPPEHLSTVTLRGSLGRGYTHRLAWVVRFLRLGEHPRWEALVDAHSGEVFLFQDMNHYVTREITGAVYPLTCTEICPDQARCGTMQAGYPMPFANTGLPAPNDYTNSAGLFDYTSGTVTTTLNGRYVLMSDACGAISESASGTIALGGVNGQHDCTSAGASPGDTPATRSGFYEVNKLIEMARGWIPGNAWLSAQLPTNMNLASTCNAYYDFVSINFYRSGGGCRNTGEIAAVFDHEWGHGMDDNDAVGAMSNSSEGYADIAGIYRLQSSCVGYGFFTPSYTPNFGCGTTADGTGLNYDEDQTAATHCNTDCSGVRDADWGKHADNTPDTPQNHNCPRCGGGGGPCGRQVHCSAAPTRQAAWDLVARDLRNPPFNYDSNTAFLIGNKLFYQGSGAVGDWHACDCTAGTADGCGATHGYRQWLAADDDNGNLNDGTPHMTAIYGAFNRHNIACATPAPTNSGCASGPSVAPTLTVAVGSNQLNLSWNAVAGAASYWVMRSEGFGGCNFGKAVIATVAGTNYSDNQVGNGRAYCYTVTPVGSSTACFGPASNCVCGTPQPCIGAVSLDKPSYSCSATMAISLLDSDLTGAGTQAVTVRSTTETTPETTVLTETPAGSGQFTGSFATTGGPPVNGDGAVSVVDGDTITVRYVDASACGTPNVAIDRTAVADCVGPVISNVQAINVTDSSATITWSTNEAANSRVTYGTSTPPGTNQDDLATYVTAHSIVLSGLLPCTTYYFSVRSADVAGNAVTANNGGVYFTFTTLGRQFLLGPDDVENGPGAWTATGPAGTVWHIDDCKASSPTRAWKAGAPQGTCPGQYANSADTYLTSAVLDLGASGHGYHLRFREWYATETGYDFCRPQVSTNGGTSWTTLGTEYSGSSGTWQSKDYDLAAFTGSNVRIRFWFHTDVSVLGEGWYVDDIDIGRPRACGAELKRQSHVVTDACATGGPGNGDGVVDPGEMVTLQLTAVNNGMVGATGVTATLSTATPGVTIVDGDASFPDIAAGGTGGSVAPHFLVAVGTGVPCGTSIGLTITFACPQGGSSDTFSILVGQGGTATTTYNSTDVPKAIPDLTTITSVINVASSATVLDVNVGMTLTHTYDGDLDIFLIGPNGTRVELSTDNGGAGDNFTGTIFDDEAAVAITAGTPPYTGSFRPEGLLSTLDGIPGNGTWTLEITDDAAADIGTLTAWSITLLTSTPQVCNGCVLTAPLETMPLTWVAGSEASLQWSSTGGASWYNVYEGTPADLPDLLNGNVDSCLRWRGTGLATGTVLTQTPPAGSFTWFLVRAANPAGEGPPGNATAGPRVHDSSGNCP